MTGAAASGDGAAGDGGAPRPALRVEGVWKSYRRGAAQVDALAGVDLAIAPGEVVFIIGPSGSGKSTLLHLLGALDRPSAGRVLLGEEDLGALCDARRALLRREHIGFVFQSFHLLDTLDALSNVLISRVPAGVTARDRERAQALLEAVGLGPRIGHRPTELSGGEQQRVAIARALLSDPALLLADEPTGELDSKTGGEVVRLLRQTAREQGRTVVIVTHDESRIEPGDRVVRLRDGRVVEDARA